MVQVNSNYYIHDFDRDALHQLNDIPAFTALIKKVMELGLERMLHIQNMANNIRINEEQLPQYYDMLQPICERLGISVPELYLEPGPLNAYTVGDTNPMIVMTTALLESCSNDEIKTVLAHECGHIACHHTLYHTVANLMFNGTLNLILPASIVALVTEAVSIALFRWYRYSEFSADRAAALVMGNPGIVQDVMIRISGAHAYLNLEINKEEYIKQGEEYLKYIGENSWNKVLDFAMFIHNDHPMNTVRALEISKWCESDMFKYLTDGTFEKASKENRCPSCGAKIGDGWAFCRKCGQRL